MLQEGKLYWKKRVSNRAWSAVRLLQIYSDKSGSKMKCGAFVRYAVRSVLLNFCLELWGKLIYNRHILIGFPPLECEESEIDGEE